MIYPLRCALLCLSALSLTLSGAASAFEIKETSDGLPISWAKDQIDYVLDERGSDDLSLGVTIAAVKDSFGQWSERPGAALALRYAGTVAGAEPGYFRDRDNQNLVAFLEDEWSFERTALAVTLTTFSTRTGDLLDADIVINGLHYKWAADGSGQRHDLSNSLAHEVGHFVGLDHSKDAEATMFPSAPQGELKKRDLASDDLQGLYFLYGDGQSPIFPGEPALPDGESPVVQSEDSGARINDAQVHLACAATPGAPGRAPLGGLLLLGVAAVATASRRRLAALLTGLTLSATLMAIFPALVGATELPELSLEALVQRSDQVVVGKVLRRHARFERGLIWTRSVISVEDCLGAANCAEGQELTLLTPGGEVDGIGQAISGLQPLPEGQRALLFLEAVPGDAERAFAPVGLSQGAWRLTAVAGRDLALRDLDGLTLLGDHGERLHGEDRSLAIPLEELTAAIARVRGSRR
jgi:hypothetical protein